MVINIRKKPSYYRDINEWMNDEFTYVSLTLEEYDPAVFYCVRVIGCVLLWWYDVLWERWWGKGKEPYIIIFITYITYPCNHHVSCIMMCMYGLVTFHCRCQLSAASVEEKYLFFLWDHTSKYSSTCCALCLCIHIVNSCCVYEYVHVYSYKVINPKLAIHIEITFVYNMKSSFISISYNIRICTGYIKYRFMYRYIHMYIGMECK